MPSATQHDLRLAERMSRLGTETAFEVLNKARALEQQGKNIIHLEIGEPDFDTPKNIIDAAIDALHSPNTDRTNLIILNSPQTPTGGVLTQRDIRDTTQVIADLNKMAPSDQIYSRLIFEGEHYSIMSVPGFKDRTILLDGFSKT